jgi:pimeloyl-ACP methyl ester carboxylesterase
MKLLVSCLVILLAAPALSEHSGLAQTPPARVAVGDVELHYTSTGSGEPVILLHGGQGDYRAWAPQIRALAPRFRAIAYSRRYHYPNDNALTSTNHSALIDADDLAGMIAGLKLGPVHLVGTSYGAYTAMAFALKHPDLVRSMVLAEPPVHRWVTTTERGAELFRAFLTNVHEPAAKAFAAGSPDDAMRIFIDAFDGKGTFDALPQERRAIVMANARFFQAIARSSDGYPNLSKDGVRRLRMPVLVIRGATTDALHAMVTEEVALVFPDASRATIPNAGHGSPRQNPEGFNSAMLPFLERHRAGGRRQAVE